MMRLRQRTAPPIARPLASLLMLAGVLCSACDVGGDADVVSGRGGGTQTPPPPLGNIDAERAFFDSSGDGTVTVVDDPSLGDVACAHFATGNGQFLIRVNPNVMAMLAQPVRDFFLFHEFGHIYLQHLTSEDPDRRKLEHWADAYGIRLVNQAAGPAASAVVVAYFDTTGAPQDATHPSHASRALYIEQVVSAYGSGNSTVPSPLPTVGTLVIGNPFGGPVGVTVGNEPIGTLGRLQSGSLLAYGDPVLGDTYLIRLFNALTNVLVLEGFATVHAPGTTFWPSPFDGGEAPDAPVAFDLEGPLAPTLQLAPRACAHVSD